MKNHRKKEKNNHIFVKIIADIMLIFAVSTMSIILYDMYINIDVYQQDYTVEKVSQETNANESEYKSIMLENASKSVVRNFKNKYN